MENNPAFLRLLRSIIAPLAEEVFECTDGNLAWAAYTTHRPDCVLMDIELKERDGLSATREIKALDPNARIIIVTSFDERRLRATAKEAGACAYELKENLLDLPRLLKLHMSNPYMDGTPRFAVVTRDSLGTPYSQSASWRAVHIERFAIQFIGICE